MKVIECTKEAFCDALQERIGDYHSKGIVPVDVVDHKEHKIKRIGVAYKRNRTDKGIMLNYCPWCGKFIGNFNDPKFN